MASIYLLLANAVLVLHGLVVAFNVEALPFIWAGHFGHWQVVRNPYFRLSHVLQELRPHLKVGRESWGAARGGGQAYCHGIATALLRHCYGILGVVAAGERSGGRAGAAV